MGLFFTKDPDLKQPAFQWKDSADPSGEERLKAEAQAQQQAQSEGCDSTL